MTKGNGQLPQTRRAAKDKLPSFRLTRRDAAMVEAVARFRALTTNQIAALFFPGSSAKPSARCLERLKRLYHHGYLSRIDRPVLRSQGRLPFVYVLDRQGAKLLSEGFGMDATEVMAASKLGRSPTFLEHHLACCDFRLAVNMAAERKGWAIEEWRDDRELSKSRDYVTLTGPKGARQRAAVVPDAWFRLCAGEHVYGFFLEVDLANVTGEATRWDRRDMSRKYRAYFEYYRSGAYEKRYRTRGLRILAVTTSDARLANLKRITEDAGGRGRFWFTTLQRVTPESVLTESIWQVATRSDLYALTW